MPKQNSPVLKRDIGSNAPDLICQLASSGYISAIQEFIANSYDADAELVDVSFSTADESALKIIDDGDGMNLGGGLQGFFRLGDSDKLANPVTKRGRRKIGKFGIATILLKYLANLYTLETFSDGKRIVVEEEFNGSLSCDRPIPYKVSPAGDHKSGTIIEMRDLNFGESDGFSLDELRRRVSWELPIAPDFKVVINGEEVHSKVIDTATEYRFEKEGKKSGKVSGVVYVTKRPTKDAGIHIYVNKRRVGDPNYFEIHKIKIGTASRLVGLIYADGIEDAILFDRGRFREDDPGFLEVVGIVRNVLNSVIYDVRKVEHRNRKRTAAERVRSLLKNTSERITEKTGQKLDIKLERTGGDVPTIIEGVLTLDKDSPVFNPAGDIDMKEYGVNVVHAVAESIILERMSGEGREVAGKFLSRKQKLVENLLEAVGHEDERIDDSGFSDFRMYSFLEVARMSGRTRGEVEKMAQSGFLSSDDSMVRGEDAVNALKKVNGYTSLWAVVAKTDATNQTLSYLTRTGQLEVYGDGFPFILDIGDSERCFFIKNEFIDDVREVLESGKTDLKRKLDKNPLEAVADRYLTIVDLGQYLDLEPSKVGEVIDYARGKGFDLRRQKESGVPKFNYLDVARAAQKMGAI